MLRNIRDIVTTIYRNMIGRPISFHCLSDEGDLIAKAYWIQKNQYEVVDMVDGRIVGDSITMDFDEIKGKFAISIPEYGWRFFYRRRLCTVVQVY